MGTLRAAKKRKVVAFDAEMLLQGARPSRRGGSARFGVFRPLPPLQRGR